MNNDPDICFENDRVYIYALSDAKVFIASGITSVIELNRYRVPL